MPDTPTAMAPSSDDRKQSGVSTSKRIPEPLRRAIAECTQQAVSFSGLSCSPYRTLQDYLEDNATVDGVYTCLMEHTRAEEKRSPPVTAKCVALLKKYLFRYPPSLPVLQLIDAFCADIIATDNRFLNSPKWPSSNQPMPPAGNTDPALAKSVTYLRTMISRKLPDSLRLQHPSAPGGPRVSPRSVLAPAVQPQATVRMSQKRSDSFVIPDMMTWRWIGKSKSWDASPNLSLGSSELNPGGAGMVPTVTPGTASSMAMADVSPLRSNSSMHCNVISGIADMSVARCHMRNIAAAKRSQAGEPASRKEGEVALNSMRRRMQRPLFHYRYYSEQQALRLSETEMEEVVSAACTGSSGPPPLPTSRSSASVAPNGAPSPSPDSADVAGSVLIKLLMDMYLSDTAASAPLAFTLLQCMLDAPQIHARVRAFDLVLNLAVHGHMLQPHPTYETDDVAAAAGLQPDIQARFESWLVGLLAEMLLFLLQVEEPEEQVWSAGLSCLLFLSCDNGNVLLSRLLPIDIRVITSLLQIGSHHGWAEVLLTHLVRMLTTMLYSPAMASPASAVSLSSRSALDRHKLKVVGGIQYICEQFASIQSFEARRNLFAIMMDYVLQRDVIPGIRPLPQDHEIAEVASAIASSDCPEILLLAFKLPEGYGTAVAQKIIASVSSSSANLNDDVLTRFAAAMDSLVSSCIRIPEDFQPWLASTLSNQWPESPSPGATPDPDSEAWAMLKSLLHSSRACDRAIGQNWLLKLLAAQLPQGLPVQPADASIQRQITVKERQNSANLKELLSGMTSLEPGGTPDSRVSGAVQLLTGLLQSRCGAVRRGFLNVLEGLLVAQTKSQAGEGDGPVAEHAQRLITLMSASLWQIIAANDSSPLNVLHMCNLILSQICSPCVLPTAEIAELSVGSPFPSHHRPPQERRLSAAHVIQESASPARQFLLGRLVVAKPLIAILPTPLLFWPLLQLAATPAPLGAFQLATAVGSGGAWGVGGVPDERAALLVLLMAKCEENEEALKEVGGMEFFRSLLDDPDSRIAYLSSKFLLKKMISEDSSKYQQALHKLLFLAQQSNNEKLLENPYLQVKGLAQFLK